MIIHEAGKRRSVFDEDLSVDDFQVGWQYELFLENDSNREGVFLLSEFCQPFSFVQIIATDTGVMPLSVKSQDCSKDWIQGGMGQFELSRNIVKPGYYLIHALQETNAVNSEAEIIVSRIVTIDQAKITSPYMNVIIETTHRMKASNVGVQLGFLEKPIRFVLERMIGNNVTTGSIPKYSVSISRNYTTRLFLEAGDQYVGYENKSKLLLEKKRLGNEEMKSKFVQVFYPKKQKGNDVIKVDGFDLFMLTPEFFKYSKEKALKQFKASDLHVVKTIRGDEFCAVIKDGKLFPIYHSWEGFSLVELNETEQVFIVEVRKMEV